MKVLYIGHYREPSGWGQVTRDNILAMDSVGIEVVPRAITFQKRGFDPPQRIKELEQQDPSNCDMCIQHVLPHLMQYHGCFKRNIGIYELETYNISHTAWPGHLNLMDELWVPCQEMHVFNRANGITAETIVVPHTSDTSRFDKEYKPLPQINQEGVFLFYYIGEFSTRKHITALLRAFHTEFSPNEPVGLVLKVSKPGISEERLVTEVNQACGAIKTHLRLHEDLDDYISEIVIPSHLTEEEIMQLHYTCDCFVMPSHGEAWSVPTFDAMGMGKFPICSQTGGMIDYIKGNLYNIGSRCGTLVEGKYDPIIAMTDHAFEQFGTARETWFDIDISALCSAMRDVYNKRQYVDEWKTAGREQAEHFSYKNIGNTIKDLLNVRAQASLV